MKGKDKIKKKIKLSLASITVVFLAYNVWTIIRDRGQSKTTRAEQQE